MGFITDAIAKAQNPDIHKGEINLPDPGQNPNHELISGPQRPIFDKLKESSIDLKIDKIK